jgi:hypothetical protein
MARRRAADSTAALACPPFLPSSTAALLLPSSVSVSSASPVAILMTVTAFAITSAGRLWPLGVRGMLTAKDTMRAQPSKGYYFPIGPAQFIAQTVDWPLIAHAGSQPRQLRNPDKDSREGIILARLWPGRIIVVYSVPESVDAALGAKATLGAIGVLDRWKADPIPPVSNVARSRSMAAYLVGGRRLRIVEEHVTYAQPKYRMGDKFTHSGKPRVTHRSTAELATLDLD